MITYKLKLIGVAALSFIMFTGFGLGDIKDKVAPSNDKCKNETNPLKKKKCERKENVKTAAKVVAIGIAAKVIYDMVVEYKSTKVKDDSQVSEDYLKTNENLPQNAQVVSYKSNINPSSLVKVGKEINIQSEVTVVPGRASPKVKIDEQIEIFDNEDNSKTIKTLTKSVNGEEQTPGAFENSFRFTLPVGMPQGVYPIKTQLLVDGKPQKNSENKMQVVLRVMPNDNYQLAYLY